MLSSATGKNSDSYDKCRDSSDKGKGLAPEEGLENKGQRCYHSPNE
jgi:hypothetical protein